LLAVGSAAGLLLGVLASKVLSYIVYQASPIRWCWIRCWCWLVVAKGDDDAA
jgi:hypothetical protein